MFIQSIKRFWKRVFNLVEKTEIGRHAQDLYLTRWLIKLPFGQRLMLHRFHRGDGEEYLHDHPWPFWSLILRGGYWEDTDELAAVPLSSSAAVVLPHTVRKWYGPGRLLRRPAEWRHKVILPHGQKCWTLVWTGRKERSWGFWPCGFMPWQEHQRRQEANLPICD